MFNYRKMNPKLCTIWSNAEQEVEPKLKALIIKDNKPSILLLFT